MEWGSHNGDKTLWFGSIGIKCNTYSQALQMLLEIVEEQITLCNMYEIRFHLKMAQQVLQVCDRDLFNGASIDKLNKYIKKYLG